MVFTVAKTRKHQNAPSFSSDRERWIAVTNRDPNADGIFYFSVRTTGVYCRPSCASRPARRENVAFYNTCEEAERAGFRPCLRCKPNKPPLAKRHAASVAEICLLIESAEEAPKLDDLAEAAGMSRYYFPPLVQVHHRRHPESLRCGSPGTAGARFLAGQRIGDRSDL